ncbi:MAG: fibronectin type III domain-containing protein [Verrucomicrobiia bacterium]
MKSLKVALNFNRMNDGDLSKFTNNVITCMTGNASFSKPPVAPADLGKLLDALDKTVAAATDGGITLTAAKNAAREALLAALRKIAAYVQIVADQDEALLLTSGFSPVNMSRSQSKLDVPLVVSVENEGTTKLTVHLKPVANARSYEVRAVNGAATPAASVISTQARRVVLGNLTPGTTYNIQARAVGGSEGYSEWSDPVSHMAI